MQDPTNAEPIAAVAKFQVLSILHDHFHVPRALHDGLLNAITREEFFSTQTQHGGGLVIRDKKAPVTKDEVDMLRELCQFTLQLLRDQKLTGFGCVNSF